MKIISASVFVLLITLLTACSGGGGGDDGGGSPPGMKPPVANLSGTWNITEDGTSNCPGEETYHYEYSIVVSQNDNNLTVSTPAGTFSGTIDGDRVSWTGSYPEDGGTTTITAMTLTVSSDGNSLSGSSSWNWSDNFDSCSGTTQAINGARVPGTGPVPEVPSGLNANAQSQSSIQLTWTDNADFETGFKLERSLSQFSGFSQIALLAENQVSYTDTGLNASTTYYYRVRAYNANGDSDYSNTAQATTFSAASGPAAPSALNTSATSSSSVSITWSDNANNESGFELERSTAEFSGFTLIVSPNANETSYADSGLTPATTYYYRIRAYNNDGYSAYSNTATATTQAAATAPPAPSGLVAAAVSGSQIDLSWTDNAGNETGFKIERSNTQSSGYSQIATTSADVTTYSSTGLSANTTYYYRVRAYNATGDSTYSNIASAATLAAAPASPSNISVTDITANSARIYWMDNADNEIGYELGHCTGLVGATGDGLVFCSSGFVADLQMPANSGTYLWTGLSESSSYSIYVRAYNNAGPSGNIGISFTTAAAPPVLRIINDLDNQLDWSQWNQIIRVRIGTSESAVINLTNTERLWPTDSASQYSTEHLGYVILPQYNQTTSYWDFDVSEFVTGDYWVYMQTGWWEYVVFVTPPYWTKHMTQVYNCDGVTPVYKWATFSVVDHTSGMLQVRASDFLPHYGWNGSPFCP